MKKVLMIAKYSHDLTYFRNIKNYAEQHNKFDLKIDIIFNLPIFFLELFLLVFPKKITQAEISEGLTAEMNRKKAKYSPLKVWFYKIFLQFIARLYFIKYTRILKHEKYHSICVWGGYNAGQRMAIIAAKKLGIKVFHFENGLLPNTTVMDLEGTNYFNSVPRNHAFYENIEPNFVKTPLVPRLAKQSKGKEILLPKKFIFCPFQVALDTQILIHSPWVKDMENFYAILESLARKTENDLIFIIKEHPSCVKDYPHLHNKNNTKIMFANENNTQDLITQAEMIVTINSTVGIEGIIYDKKIVTLGNAFYSGYGFAKQAKSEQELLEIIQTRNDWIINPEDNAKFLSYLQNIYLIPGSWKNPNIIHLDAIIKKLIQY
jgi:capsular polysaccharide export protein